MTEFRPRSPYMDYRKSIPFIDLSNYIINRPIFVLEQAPQRSLKEYLLRKRLSTMINLRRLQYRKQIEDYRNGR